MLLSSYSSQDIVRKVLYTGEVQLLSIDSFFLSTDNRVSSSVEFHIRVVSSYILVSHYANCIYHRSILTVNKTNQCLTTHILTNLELLVFSIERSVLNLKRPRARVRTHSDSV